MHENDKIHIGEGQMEGKKMLKKPYILLLFSGVIFIASYSEHDDSQYEDKSGHFQLVKTNTKQAIDPELASLQEPTIGESTVEEPFPGKKAQIKHHKITINQEGKAKNNEAGT